VNTPLIAVSARPRRAGEVAQWPATAATVVQNLYLEGVWRAGGMEAVIAPREIDVDTARALLRRVDGLVGGGDVDPARYGETPEPEVYGIEAASDQLELSLATAAIELGIPTLAICRGMQVVNVALGGTLVQHVTGRDGYQHHGQPGHGHAEHDVRVEPGTLLAKTQGGASSIAACWSYHHQVLGDVAGDLMVSARSDDGAIEAVELADPSTGWMVGIQWHPERQAAANPAQQALFDELVRQASARAAGR
jgi:putative glutamine amidotransferase